MAKDIDRDRACERCGPAARERSKRIVTGTLGGKVDLLRVCSPFHLLARAGPVA